MANAPVFTSIITIYLAIGLLLAVVGGATGTGINNDVASSFINTSSGEFSEEVINNKPNLDQESGAISGVLNFIDALRSVRAFLKFLGTVVFALPMVFFDAQIPELIIILVGSPMAIIAIISLIYLIRSGN